MKKIYLVAFFVLVGLNEASAQQDPHYTQYMYNMNVINPAYAGSKETLSFGLLYRKQWANLEGAPSTATFSGHGPIGTNVGLGLSVISDKIGPVEENNMYADFSYILSLGGEHKLALGLKAGATFHKVGLLSDVSPYVPDADDPAFVKNTNRRFFNAGAGVFYYTNQYYLAASIPNMFKATYLDYNGRKFGSATQHYFVTGGYVFDLSENAKFKPFFMVKSAFDAPVSLDVSTNFLFYDKFEIGATYRLNDSFGAMVNYAISPSFSIGYAYDHIVSDLKTTTPSSHEFIVLFDLYFSKSTSKSPRYF